jgi:site-specific recombinase XerD
VARLTDKTPFWPKYVYKELTLTLRDLLEDVERFSVDEAKQKPKVALSPNEMEAVRASFNLPTFEHVRDRAIFEVHMATAFRYDTVLAMPWAALDRVSGRVTV